MRLVCCFLVVSACSSDSGPLQMSSVEPRIGSVAGGTRLTIEGSGLSSVDRVEIGGIPCEGIATTTSHVLTCTTGSSDYVEGVVDVVLANDRGETVALPAAFEYQCPWTTAAGRRTCGAAPPRMLGEQPIASWITKFEAGHGFATDGGPANMDDTSDFAIGDRSAWIETDGASTPRLLARTNLPAIDMRDHYVKIWIKVDQIAAVSSLELYLGDSGFANAFRFRLQSQQGQQWITNGDWVAFSLSWAATNYTTVGSPNRAAITDVGFRVVDVGIPVKLHVNGIALVPEPIDIFPQGVVSFTFDDNHIDMVDVAAPILDRHGFPATAYVIIDRVELPGRATLAQLGELQAKGWDVAAHALTSAHHDARFPTLPSAVVEDDLVDQRAWLMKHRLRGYDHCAYPGGDFTYNGDNILPIASRYFSSCRTIYQRQREAVPPSDPFKLRVLYITSGTPLATVLTAIDQAKVSREWIILVFHKLVPDTPEVLTEWTVGDFQAVVEHVAASEIPVKAISAVLETTH